MKTENNKIHNHRYSIDIPDNVYMALKIKATMERKTIKDIIMTSLQEVLGDDFANLPANEKKEMLSFTGSSNKILSREWSSQEDDEAFANLQKYKKK